jgi:hypothetical protein
MTCHRIATNSCHSERSEEPPHFAFAVACSLLPITKAHHPERSRVPHTSILMYGHRAKLDRLPLRATPNTVISTEAMDSFTVHRAVERPPHFAVAVARSLLLTNHSCHSERSEEPPYFAFAFVVAFAVASEIGPGFSPDIHTQQKKPGFSPWDMLSYPSREAQA